MSTAAALAVPADGMNESSRGTSRAPPMPMKHSNIANTPNVAELRRQARANLNDGAMTSNYGGDVAKTIELLNNALATETVCVLRYRFHYFAAQSLNSEAIKAEFLQHAVEEQAHADLLAARIAQLGGKPNLDPATLVSRSATEYREGSNLVDMIKEDLVAERIAVEVYRDMVRYFGDRDPTTRRMLEGILAQEEEHANDMHDLLVAHEGQSLSGRAVTTKAAAVMRDPSGR